ncbi:unnamed protein product [Clonostachys chloroleuca]|uniref:Uncharacterized protein n=1 Tax=Clonostachys chloroleuca TaxID=1926264 RepID=A0AA35MDR5_9HYPO|nr:unnamed protein product [Clonostachys chloroleuca]
MPSELIGGRLHATATVAPFRTSREHPKPAESSANDQSRRARPSPTFVTLPHQVATPKDQKTKSRPRPYRSSAEDGMPFDRSADLTVEARPKPDRSQPDIIVPIVKPIEHPSNRAIGANDKPGADIRA